MSFSETSWLSYVKCQEEGLFLKHQITVLKYLHTHDREEGICQREVGRAFKDVNCSISPRFITLERHGLITKVGMINDKLTNRLVGAYRLTGKLPKKKVLGRKFKKICPNCRQEVKRLINVGYYGGNNGHKN